MSRVRHTFTGYKAPLPPPILGSTGGGICAILSNSRVCEPDDHDPLQSRAVYTRVVRVQMCGTKARTAGELVDDRLKSRSSSLNGRARFRNASLDERKPSKPCARLHDQAGALMPLAPQGAGGTASAPVTPYSWGQAYSQYGAAVGVVCL